MHLNPHQGKFIVFEGAEGGGKSTQARMLEARMRNAGYHVLLTKEPTEDGVFGKLVRFIYQCESLQGALPEFITAFMSGVDYQRARAAAIAGTARYYINEFEDIAAELQQGDHARLQKFLQLGMTYDRRDHRDRVEIPALSKGVHVISDRDFPSTPAYAAADNLDWREFFDLQLAIVAEHFIIPDIILFLRIPVEIGLDRTRAKQAGRKEYFDSSERLVKIARAYEEIFADPRIKNAIPVVTLDGARPIEEVYERVWREIEPMIISA